MKTKTTIAAICLTLAPFAFSEEKGHEGHDHTDHAEATHKDVEQIDGPHKGRILTTTEPHSEIFITDERKILVTFLDKDNKAITPTDQVVSAIGGDRSAPTRMTFAIKGDSLISDKSLPDGNMIPLILQIKTGVDADNVTERFNVDFSECPTCDHIEYACVCEHE